jgi:uridine kinase
MIEMITIYCKNRDTYGEVRIGSSLAEIYAALGTPLEREPLCARVNNRVKGLTYRCWKPKDVEFVDYTDPSGYRVYLRSLCFILSKAVNDLFPGRQFNLEHPVSKGYYCVYADRGEMTPDAVNRIRARMTEITARDLPFCLKTVRTPDAVQLFRDRGMNDKASLLETAGMPYASYCELDGYVDYFYGCLTPSSGFIRLFDVVPYAKGLLLRVPQPKDPAVLCPVVRQDKMFDAYKQFIQLQRTLQLDYAGDLNCAIRSGHAGEVIRVSEAVQEKNIASIAEEIARRYHDGGVRVALISGPSSSGKTTFCRRIAVQLKANLLHPLDISLDDYYLNREDTPRDDEGNYDFESLYAIDLPYFKNDLQRLIAGEEIETPSYNFGTGRREYRGKKLKLRQHSILLLEGIHGLNPFLTDNIPPESIFKIYVSALTTISLDGHNHIPATDNRLLRRIVRDCQFRGYSAKQTIAMWPRVRRGEDQWIFPYQEHADRMFNSAMIYEFAALRRYAEPVLNEVFESDEEYAEAYRLLRFLRYFNYIPEDDLPRTSLLREFLGGGRFNEP